MDFDLKEELDKIDFVKDKESLLNNTRNSRSFKSLNGLTFRDFPIVLTLEEFFYMMQESDQSFTKLNRFDNLFLKEKKFSQGDLVNFDIFSYFYNELFLPNFEEDIIK